MERFPIQGGLTVSHGAALRAYRTYSGLYGTGQSLERLAERGGFGLLEFVMLFDTRTPGRDQLPDTHRIAWILNEAHLRSDMDPLLRLPDDELAHAIAIGAGEAKPLDVGFNPLPRAHAAGRTGTGWFRVVIGTEEVVEMSQEDRSPPMSPAELEQAALSAALARVLATAGRILELKHEAAQRAAAYKH